jgi:hypothetical protein
VFLKKNAVVFVLFVLLAVLVPTRRAHEKVRCCAAHAVQAVFCHHVEAGVLSLDDVARWVLLDVVHQALQAELFLAAVAVLWHGGITKKTKKETRQF